MKRVLLCVVGLFGVMALMIPTMADAQAAFAIDKGSIGISGTASFSSQSGDLYEDSEGNGSTTISVAPSVFYFIIPNLAIGADVSFSSYSWGDYSMTSYALGPRVLYAFGKMENSIYPYVGAGFNYSHTGNDTDVNGTRIKLGGGVFILPVQQQHLGITVEAGVLLDSMKPDVEGAESASGTMISVGVGLVGFLF